MANMLILGIADLLTRKPRLLARVALNQLLVGILGIFLTVVAVLGVLSDGASGVPVGLSTVVIGFAYAGGMRLLHRNREEPVFRTRAEVAEAAPRRRELRLAVVGFAASALVIVIAAPFLAASAATLAVEHQLSHGFAGMVFLAVTTSLPEAAVTWGSVRAGAYNLAVGNLLGSNCFNMAALIPLDVVQGRGAMLAGVEHGLAVSGLFAVLMTALAMLDVMNKAERKFWILEPGPAFLILTYAAGLYAAYAFSGP
jgi:cation:H+ antiporter